MESYINKKLIIGSDHAGFETKKELKDYFGHYFKEVIDVGTFSNDSCDYPIIAKKLANHLENDNDALGVLICGTGIGMCMAANKFEFIRCANVINKEFAKLAKMHNNANVLALSARFVSINENIEIIKEFMITKFEDRHQKRIDMLSKIKSL